MKARYNIVLLFFAITITSISMAGNDYVSLSEPVQHSSDDSDFISTIKVNLFTLPRTIQKAESPVAGIPGGEGNSAFKNYGSANLSAEVRLCSLTSRYIYYTVTDTPGLTLREIIFPSHFFW